MDVRPDGLRIARLDYGRVAAWCRSVALPVPLLLVECEPAVAEALIEALQEAALHRSAAALGRLGQVCESLDAHRSAEEYFRLAASADPRDYRWPYYLGCIAQVTGRNSEAVAFFTEAKRLNPEYPVTYARLAQLFIEMERDDEAAAMSQRFAMLRPRDWLGFVGMGRVALRRGEHENALRYFREAVERGPKDFQSHYYLAKTYTALGQEKEAKKHFAISARLPRGAWFHHRDPLDQALHRSIDSTAALQDQLEELKESEDWPQLAGLAERLVERRPNDMNMLCNLASYYRKLTRYEDAHRTLERAGQVSPDSALVHSRRAEVYLAQKRPDDALRCVERAHLLGPPDAYTLSVQGRALYLLQRYTEAEEAMRKALKVAPDNPGNCYVLGEILRAAGRLDEAAHTFRRVLELRPNDAQAKARLAELQSPRSP